MDDKMTLPFYMQDLATFCLCFGLSADDLNELLFEDEEIYS